MAFDQKKDLSGCTDDDRQGQVAWQEIRVGRGQPRGLPVAVKQRTRDHKGASFAPTPSCGG